MTRRTIFLLAAVAGTLACGGDKTVHFGAILPLTGDASIYGQPIEHGVQLAFDELQARDDFPYAVDLRVEDSQSDPERARELLAEMYSEGVLAVIGGVITTEALQMVPVADEYDRILVSPSASTPELTGISKNFYRVFPSDAREGTTMGNFATQKLKVGTVVILAKQEPYAKGIQSVFAAEFTRHGGEVLDLIEFPADSSEFSGLAERVMTLKPDAVYLAAYAIDVARLIEELRKHDFQGTIFTTAAFAAPEVIHRLGRTAEGVFLTQSVFEVESEDPKIHAFVETYRERFGYAPDLYAAHGYDAMMVLAEALVEGGPLSNEFWKGMRSVREIPGVTGMIQFDERGDVQKFPRVYVVNDGILIDYDKEVERRRRELLERLRRLESEQRRSVDSGS